MHCFGCCERAPACVKWRRLAGGRVMASLNVEGGELEPGGVCVCVTRQLTEEAVPVWGGGSSACGKVSFVSQKNGVCMCVTGFSFSYVRSCLIKNLVRCDSSDPWALG